MDQCRRKSRRLPPPLPPPTDRPHSGRDEYSRRPSRNLIPPSPLPPARTLSDWRSSPPGRSNTERLPPGFTTSADSMSEAVGSLSCKNRSIQLRPGTRTGSKDDLLFGVTTIRLVAVAIVPGHSDWRMSPPGRSCRLPPGPTPNPGAV